MKIWQKLQNFENTGIYI